MKDEIRNEEGLTEEEFIKGYDPAMFERPSVTVDMLIFTVAENKLKLLLIKRKNHPGLGKWALPGGFVNMDESLEEAGARELKEETNLEDVYLEQLYTWGEVKRDPRTRIITVTYIALVKKDNMKVAAGDDAAEAKWFDVELRLLDKRKTNCKEGFIFNKEYFLELKGNEEKVGAKVEVSEKYCNKVLAIKRNVLSADSLAFDHGVIIQYAIEFLRKKIKDTPIIFSLLPEMFTLEELKEVYEIILGEKITEEFFKNISIKYLLQRENKTGDKDSKLYSLNGDSAYFTE